MTGRRRGEREQGQDMKRATHGEHGTSQGRFSGSLIGSQKEIRLNDRFCLDAGAAISSRARLVEPDRQARLGWSCLQLAVRLAHGGGVLAARYRPGGAPAVARWRGRGNLCGRQWRAAPDVLPVARAGLSGGRSVAGVSACARARAYAVDGRGGARAGRAPQPAGAGRCGADRGWGICARGRSAADTRLARRGVRCVRAADGRGHRGLHALGQAGRERGAHAADPVLLSVQLCGRCCSPRSPPCAGRR